jgi:hypothetical protein
VAAVFTGVVAASVVAGAAGGAAGVVGVGAVGRPAGAVVTGSVDAGLTAWGREAEQAAATVVTSNAATTGAQRRRLAEIMATMMAVVRRDFGSPQSARRFYGDSTARATMSVPKAVRIAR